MLKKLLFPLVVATFAVTLFSAEDCHAGHEDITLTPTEEFQDGMKDLFSGKIPMTRTLIHEEIPFDTQYRTKIRKLVNKHLDQKRITIKVRTDADRNNDVYQDPAVNVDSSTSSQSTKSKYRVTVSNGNVTVAENRESILNTVMQEVEALKTNPQNVIVVDIT